MSKGTAPRLSGDHLPPGVPVPDYDRGAKRSGIVHFGLGAFTRAHQAWYTDRAMALAGGDWMVTGVSLRSAEVGEQLNPQDGLYALAEKSGAGTALRVIGSVRQVLLALTQAAEVVAAVASPDCQVVTFTVTEKGYCRRADGSLDAALAAQGFYPLLGEALERRRAGGSGGLTLLSCDNLADNGHQLRRLLGQWLEVRDPDLARWVEDTCTFPSSMVDRIVPATTAVDRDAAEALLGLRDEGLVVTEPFSQWVIEDSFVGPRPAWNEVGAEIVGDVAPYETAKLRMLNGAHSALAYLGLAKGYDYVHEAVANSELRATIERLMRDEAAPTIAAAPGQDLSAYADALLRRFANPALNHRLRQIAMDGSQKIPQRWMATMAAQRRRGQDCPAIDAALRAWFRHLRGANGPVDDPLASELQALALGLDDDALLAALFGQTGLLGEPAGEGAA